MHNDLDVSSTLFTKLINNNHTYIKNYQNNPLIRLIKSNNMQSREARLRLLDSIQIFSDYFQKVIMLRSAFCEKPKFLMVAQIHLNEEFGHNSNLKRDRNDRQAIWDPILDAASSWFAWKMFVLNDGEKTVLIHLVLEASANIFFHEAHKVMDRYGETKYFQIHADIDEAHENMGKELLSNLPDNAYTSLFDIQAKGWDMVNTICSRIAQITVRHNAKSLPAYNLFNEVI